MTIYIPMDRNLYNDIVRFSNGQIDPASMAEEQLLNWIIRDLEFGDGECWGDNFKEIAKTYAPHVLEQMEKEERDSVDKYSDDRKPLVWKELTIPAETEVRMAYPRGHQHYAIVKGGHILNEGKKFSPSEWASKVAGGTSRSAWRDLWFRFPNSNNWMPAQLLRDQAISAQRDENAKLLKDIGL